MEEGGPAPHLGSIQKQNSRQLAPPLVHDIDGRAGPAPCLGSVGELLLAAKHWKASPYDMDMGELTLALAWVEGMLALVV